MRNKIEELRLLAEHKPDVIWVVETWLNANILDCKLNIVNYYFERKDRIIEST